MNVAEVEQYEKNEHRHMHDHGNATGSDCKLDNPDCLSFLSLSSKRKEIACVICSIKNFHQWQERAEVMKLLDDVLEHENLWHFRCSDKDCPVRRARLMKVKGTNDYHTD